MSSKRVLLVLGILVVGLTLWAGDAAAETSLFVNLTSDEMNRAAMAIGLATRVRTEAAIPVTVFLNVDGVNLADARRPQNVHASGKTVHAMLAEFVDAGGSLVVCPMCLEHVGGMAPDDLIAGCVLGDSDHGMPELLADGVRVLSY